MSLRSLTVAWLIATGVVSLTVGAWHLDEQLLVPVVGLQMLLLGLVAYLRDGPGDD